MPDFFEDDLSVFYDEADFAVHCTRERPGEDDQVFQGILATADEERFAGNLRAGVSCLRYPTESADLVAGDVVRIQRLQDDGTYSEAEAWRVVQGGQRTVDGRETDAYLAPDPNA